MPEIVLQAVPISVPSFMHTITCQVVEVCLLITWQWLHRLPDMGLIWKPRGPSCNEESFYLCASCRRTSDQRSTKRYPILATLRNKWPIQQIKGHTWTDYISHWLSIQYYSGWYAPIKIHPPNLMDEHFIFLRPFQVDLCMTSNKNHSTFFLLW